MSREIHPFRVLVKALCLFFVINFLYVLIPPAWTGVSGYHTLFPGRTRLPFGIRGDPYTVTVEDVDDMFASHLIAAPRSADEYRVVLLGDSSVWGEGIGAYDVISEHWNRTPRACGDKTIRAYNLGYPHPSVLKDLVILDKALEYEPDLVVWFVTLNTVISQRVNPFLIANRERAVQVLQSHDLSFRQGKRLAEDPPGFFERTLIGQRSDLARRIKLEFLGIIWMATGADTNTLAEDEPPSFHVEEDPAYRGMEPPEDLRDLLLFSSLDAGQELAAPTPVLIVNEPMYIAPGAETRVRYNAGYPRWAYDQYRAALSAHARGADWYYLDLWNAIPREYFLDAALHLGADGERLLVAQIDPAVRSLICSQIP